MKSRHNKARGTPPGLETTGSRPAQIDEDERRENAARPHPFLGYNRDTLGLYFFNRGAEHTAEAQFRRAIWLNPYEPEFKLHLAGCLFKQHRYDEAKTFVQQALEKLQERRDARTLLDLIESHLCPINSDSPHSSHTAHIDKEAET